MKKVSKSSRNNELVVDVLELALIHIYLRNSRLRLAHDVVRSFAAAAGVAGASYVSRKAAGPTGPEGYEEVKEIYSPYGDKNGSIYTRRRYSCLLYTSSCV